MKKLIFLLLGLSLIASADRSEDLLAENQKSKSYIKSFYMDCSNTSPLCIERIEALRGETRFNDIFEEALSRNMHTWPNNEILRAEEAIELRKIADNSFKEQFFGNASDSYKEATEIIFEVLEEADLTVKELLELGEEYLFKDGKPDWAAPYYNDALPYDPENRRIIDGLARIKFLRSFEDDIKNIENLILIADYQKALVLINETMRGDPGNKTLQGLRVQATEELKAVEINFLLYELNSENYNLSLDEKKEKLTKIQNAISLYGAKLLGEDIQSAKRELEDLIYTERVQELKEAYAYSPDELEMIYQSAKDLSTDYPNKIEALNFLRLLKESRNKLKLTDLKASAILLTSSELWTEAINVLQEIYIVKKSEEIKKQISDIENIISLLSQINEMQEKLFLTDSQDFINDSKSLLKELKTYSSESTPKLNNNLIEFSDLINEKQKLATKESKGNKTNEVAIASANDLARSKNNQPTKLDYASANFQKASLIKSSFAKAIDCRRATKNKKFTSYFRITVLSSGKAKEVTISDEDQFKSLSNASRDVLKVVKKALSRSKYNPAQQEGVAVESIFKQKLVMGKNFCQE